jgi:hypothetical protein
MHTPADAGAQAAHQAAAKQDALTFEQRREIGDFNEKLSGLEEARPKPNPYVLNPKANVRNPTPFTLSP